MDCERELQPGPNLALQRRKKLSAAPLPETAESPPTVSAHGSSTVFVFTDAEKWMSDFRLPALRDETVLTSDQERDLDFSIFTLTQSRLLLTFEFRLNVLATLDLRVHLDNIASL